MASGPIISWQMDGETVETVADFIFLGSKITADSDCSHEIKRRLLVERKVLTNLDSILKSRSWERRMEREESTYLTSGSTTKPQLSRQYGTGTKTEI